MNGEQRGSFISLPVSPHVYTKRVRIFAVIFAHEIRVLLATSPSPSLEGRAMKEIEGFVNVRRMFVYIYIYIFGRKNGDLFDRIPLFTITNDTFGGDWQFCKFRDYVIRT